MTTDTPLMAEARELIAFYDERERNWESALAFTLCRDVLGNRLGIYDPKTHFLMPIRGRLSQDKGAGK